MYWLLHTKAVWSPLIASYSQVTGLLDLQTRECGELLPVNGNPIVYMSTYGLQMKLKKGKCSHSSQNYTRLHNNGWKKVGHLESSLWEILVFEGKFGPFLSEYMKTRLWEI